MTNEEIKKFKPAEIRAAIAAEMQVIFQSRREEILKKALERLKQGKK